jgi:hypothetical protein
LKMQKKHQQEQSIEPPENTQTDRQTHTHTQTHRQTHRHTDTQTHRHTDTQTHTQTHRHTETQTQSTAQHSTQRQSNPRPEIAPVTESGHSDSLRWLGCRKCGDIPQGGTGIALAFCLCVFRLLCMTDHERMVSTTICLNQVESDQRLWSFGRHISIPVSNVIHLTCLNLAQGLVWRGRDCCEPTQCRPSAPSFSFLLTLSIKSFRPAHPGLAPRRPDA